MFHLLRRHGLFLKAPAFLLLSCFVLASALLSAEKTAPEFSKKPQVKKTNAGRVKFSYAKAETVALK